MNPLSQALMSLSRSLSKRTRGQALAGRLRRLARALQAAGGRLFEGASPEPDPSSPSPSSEAFSAPLHGGYSIPASALARQREPNLGLADAGELRLEGGPELLLQMDQREDYWSLGAQGQQWDSRPPADTLHFQLTPGELELLEESEVEEISINPDLSIEILLSSGQTLIVEGSDEEPESERIPYWEI